MMCWQEFAANLKGCELTSAFVRSSDLPHAGKSVMSLCDNSVFACLVFDVSFAQVLPGRNVRSCTALAASSVTIVVCKTRQ